MDDADDPNITDFSKARADAVPPQEGGQAVQDPEEEKREPEEFPIECLPPVLANMARAMSELGRWPLRLTGPLVLAAASAALGRGVRVKSYDGHETRPNLFLIVAKESGSGGTSAFRLAFAPLYGYQALKRREFTNG